MLECCKSITYILSAWLKILSQIHRWYGSTLNEKIIPRRCEVIVAFSEWARNNGNNDFFNWIPEQALFSRRDIARARNSRREYHVNYVVRRGKSHYVIPICQMRLKIKSSSFEASAIFTNRARNIDAIFFFGHLTRSSSYLFEFMLFHESKLILLRVRID